MCFCPLFNILRKGQFQSCFIPWNQSYEIKLPPQAILVFKILEILSVEN
jgi:hypothetical protein